VLRNRTTPSATDRSLLKEEIGGRSSLPLRLDFVASFDPVRKGRTPREGALGKPCQAALPADFEEGPGDIVSPVACEEEEPARFQETMDMSKIGPVDEPTLVMARLRPGIGVKKIDAFERGAGQDFEEVARVAVMNANIVEAI